MAIKEINIDDWFGFNAFEDELEDAVEQLAYEKEFAETWADIKKLAERCLSQISAKPKDDKILMSSLSEFYESWKKNDAASDTEIRDQVSEFIRQVIAKSETKMHAHDAFYDVLYGHVGVKIFGPSELKPKVSDKEIQSATAWIERSLKEHLEADLPGLITIKLYKPRAGAEIPKDFLIHSSFSLILKDLTGKTMLDVFDFNEDLTEPTADELKSAQKLSKSLLETLKQGTAPLKISGLGTFQYDDLPGYEGHNPRTNEMVKVSGRRIIVFRMDRDLKERLTKAVLG